MGIKTFGISLIFVAGGAMAIEMPDIKPGLWEQSVQYESDTGELERTLAEAQKQMKQQMQNMPPEQRKMMEDMMAKRGMDFDLDRQTFRQCLTEEDIRDANFDLSGENTDCEQEIVSQTSSRVEIEFSCQGEAAGTGRGEINVHNDENYTGKFEVSTDINGKPTNLIMQSEGRWLGADCGSEL